MHGIAGHGMAARACALSMAAALAVAPGVAQAQGGVEEFYRGKTINMIIGYSPGGGYDVYARLVARFIGNHIPGKPAVVPRNMPGASSRSSTAYVYTVAPKDGTVLATGDQSFAMQQAMGEKFPFDTSKLIFIGNPLVENNTTATWHASGIKTIEDAKRQEVSMGATGSSASSQYPRVMNAVLGTKFRVVLGYPGGNEINLAMERGEVAGRGSNNWASWKGTRAEWLRDKKINILVQIGLRKAPDLPDVPLLMDLAANDEDRLMLRLLSAPSNVGRPLFTTPDVPADRVKALRAAFDAAMKDPGLIDEAKRGNLELDPLPGVELQQVIIDILATPSHIGKRLASVLAEGSAPGK
jgi:tripartite-type tricarboxylate transporter receptor subunit TctC